MSYVALYRAYRPKSFSEVAGQKHVVKTLQNAIKLDKVSHAYLFSGPRGTGKTTIAKILAKAINCEHGPAIEPCNKCDVCAAINAGSNPDVIEIDAASNNGVDEIREIRDKVRFLPSMSRRKVYIIDEVHMLSTGAFNALLKTLEEPPKHVIFILATTEPQKIPLTILSRVQRFDFLGISEKEIIEVLNRVCKSEKIKISDEALDIISTSCDGGMRDALSLLDQAISYSASGVVEASDVLAVSGNVSNITLLELLNNVYNKEQASAVSALDDIISSGKEVTKILSDLIELLKNVLLYNAGVYDKNKSIFKEDLFKEYAKKIKSQKLYGYLDILSNCQSQIKFTNQKKAYLELAILKMSDYSIVETLDIKDKVENLEKIIENLDSMPQSTQEEQSFPSFEDDTEEPLFNNAEPEQEKEIKVEIKDIKEEVKIDSTFITTHDLEKVLNNGNKQAKPLICQVIESEVAHNPNNLGFSNLAGAKIVACSNDEFIAVFSKVTLCNMMMKDPIYTEVLKTINSKLENKLSGFYAIPSSDWNSIIKDYLSKYKDGDKKPVLNEIKILVKKHVVQKDESEELINTIKELFDEDKIEIIEGTK